MERDFMGLSSKNGVVTVKDDAADGSKDPAVRIAGMQWSFSNKVSALPQFLSFKTIQEDRPRKTALDSLTSSGYMTISTADAFDSNQKPFLGVIQNNITMGKQARNIHGTTFYSRQHFDAHSACSQDAKVFSISSQPNQASPVLQSNIAITSQNIVSSAIKPQTLGGVPLIAPASILPSMGSIVGTTDLRNSSKSSGMPAQLTIFYAGSVCVYDDITPEKAQAIMLLAGNGSTPIHNKTISTAQVRAPVSRPSQDDGFIISQSYPSPLPVTSQLSSQPGGGSSSNNERAITRSLGSSPTASNHLESPNVVGSVGSAATKMVPPVGLPQARKASLARFLEKRKERVMSASPYYMSKKSPECGTPGSDGVGYSVNSSGPCPLPVINQEQI